MENPDDWPELSQLGQEGDHGVAQAAEHQIENHRQSGEQSAPSYHLPQGPRNGAPAAAPEYSQPPQQPQGQAPQQTQAPQVGQVPQQPAAAMPGQQAPEYTQPPAYAPQAPEYGQAPEFTQPPQYANPAPNAGAAPSPDYTHPPQPQYQQPQSYTQPPQHQAYQQPGDQQGSYQHDPAAAGPAGGAQAPSGQTGEFDRYAPPPARAPAEPAFAPVDYPDPTSANAGEPAFEPRGTIHDHHPQAVQPPEAADHSGANRGEDPRGYDLGQYSPSTPFGSTEQQGADPHAAGAYAQAPDHASAHAQAQAHDASTQSGQFEQQGGYEIGSHAVAGAATGPALAPGQAAYGEFGQQAPADFHGQEAQEGYAPQYDLAAGQDAHGNYDAHQDEYEIDEDGYGEEPERGGRGLLIASALVGAIALGGGLAFAYKHLGGGARKPATGTKIIAADSRPTKIKPKDPGGRVFPGRDKKVFGTRASGSARQTSSNVAGSGVRKVPTIAITPRTPVARPPTAAPVRVATAPAAASRQESDRLTVQGITVEGMGMTIVPPRMPQRRVAPVQRQAAPQVASTSRGPVVLPRAKPFLKPPILPKATKPTPKPPVQRQAAVQVPKKPKRIIPAAAPAPRAGTGGYVAWISSSKDKMRSLASFASLAQKFPKALAGKQPEIQQIEVPNRGTWYRLRIGPPASREATKALCDTLVAGKGVKQCFLRRY